MSRDPGACIADMIEACDRVAEYTHGMSSDVFREDRKTVDAVHEALVTRLVKYHKRRAHQALGWMTPSEYRAAHLSKPAAQAA